jgi:hypothetical protein
MNKEIDNCQEAIVELMGANFELYHEKDEDGKNCAQECSLLINKMLELTSDIRRSYEHHNNVDPQPTVLMNPPTS